MDVVTLASPLCAAAQATSGIVTTVVTTSALGMALQINSTLTIGLTLVSVIEREDEA